MKKLLLLLLLSLGFIGSAYAETFVLTCNAKSVDMTQFGANTNFPNSTKTITMILEGNSNNGITKITFNDIGYKGEIRSSIFKILKQDTSGLTALGNNISAFGGDMLFLNLQDGTFSHTILELATVSSTVGRCYE